MIYFITFAFGIILQREKKKKQNYKNSNYDYDIYRTFIKPKV